MFKQSMLKKIVTGLATITMFTPVFLYSKYTAHASLQNTNQSENKNTQVHAYNNSNPSIKYSAMQNNLNHFFYKKHDDVVNTDPNINYYSNDRRDATALREFLNIIFGTCNTTQIQFSNRVDSHPELFCYPTKDDDTSWNRGNWAYDETWTIPKLNDYKNKSAEDTIKQGTATNNAGIIIKGDIHDAAVRSYNHFHKNKLLYNDTLSGDDKIISDKQAVIDFYRANIDLIYRNRFNDDDIFGNNSLTEVVHEMMVGLANDDPRVFYPWEETIPTLSSKNSKTPKYVSLHHILILHKHGFSDKQIAKQNDLSVSEIKDDILNTKYEKGSPISDTVFPSVAYRPKWLDNDQNV